MFSKKGQSALEYLMTYGWALVVIVIVIAALVFLIQPSQVGGNTCAATSGILITNHQVSGTNDNLQIILSNQTAATITDGNLSVSGTVGGVPTTGARQVLQLGTIEETETIGLTPVFESSATYSLQVDMNYRDRDGLLRTLSSTCNGTAS